MIDGPRLIALTARRESGKSEVARILRSHGFQTVKFADPLKAMLRTLGLTDWHLEGPGKTRPCVLLGNRTPVHAMQTLGTEWGRDLIDPDLWVDLWRPRAADALDHYGLVVADDLRFPNEAEAVRSMGGLVWRVERPREGVVGADHVSESYEAAADAVIQNSGGLDELSRAVSVALQQTNMASKKSP